MHKKKENRLYDAYQDLAVMLIRLTKKIREADELRKDHRAYLPSLNEIVELSKRYSEDLADIIRGVQNAQAESKEDMTFDGILALNGDFYLVRQNFLMTLYMKIEALYYAVSFLYEHGCGKNEGQECDSIKDIHDILKNIKDRWDHMEVAAWRREEGESDG